MKCILINLDQRADRYQKMLKQIENQSDFYPVERFSAINGNELIANRQLEQLFNPNDYNFRRGIIGCALSHLTIWTEIINSKITTPVLILEDDAILVDDCKAKIEYCLEKIQKEDLIWDIIFLGYIPREATSIAEKSEDIQIEKWSTQESNRRNAGGTQGYIIHPSAISNLLAFIQTIGMTNAIDTMMIRACDFLSVYYCVNPLIYQSEHIISQNPITLQFRQQPSDSDIQHNFLSMKRPLTQRLNEELKYYSDLGVPTLIAHDEVKDLTHFQNQVVFCHYPQPPLKNTLSYGIENITVHIPYTLLQNVPPLYNIGLIYNGQWSTKQLIVIN